jgi:uncharacterized protein (DUF302 family)
MKQTRRAFMGTMVTSALGLMVSIPKLSLHMTPQGIALKASKYSVKESCDRVQQFLSAHGATIYNRIDQQSELSKAGLTIPPLEFLLFGNPKAGGLLMMKEPLAALDLPLKVIFYEDADKAVWVAYNEAAFVQNRYFLPDDISGPLHLEPIITKALA